MENVKGKFKLSIKYSERHFGVAVGYSQTFVDCHQPVVCAGELDESIVVATSSSHSGFA
jgi:hypothetical protein